MKRIFFGLFLWAWCGLALAQQPAQPSGPPPPATTPPTFPEDKAPTIAASPDTKAPEALSTDQVKQQIQEKLNTEPELAHTPVRAKVGPHTVTLKGNVASERQHDLALRIAQSYAGERKIVDRIKVRQGS